VLWYRKAAKLGNAIAAYNLGHSFEHGTGVIKSQGEAVGWYRNAAKLGSEEAKEALKRLGESE
jgi:TPR repeat protein